MISNELLNLIDSYRDIEKSKALLSNSKEDTAENKRKIFEISFKLKGLASQIKKQISDEIFGTYVKGILFKTAYGDLVAHVCDIEISRSLGFDGEYGNFQINFLKKIISNEDTIYIIGAHVGTFTIPISRHCKAIYAFEPNPETFEFLRINVLLNNLKNTTIFNVGTYYKEDKIAFLQSVANSGGSKIMPHKRSYMYDYDKPRVINIDVTRLDEFIEKEKLVLPDILILDIEGSEFATLKGAKRSLENCKYLYMEFISNHFQNVANVTINALLNELLSYFTKVQIVGNDNVFSGQKFRDLIFTIFVKEISCDLLFSKG